MNNQYPNIPVYAPAYPPNNQESEPDSAPQPHNAQTAHTLPPLPTGNHAASSLSSDAYPPRTQSLHALMSAAQQSGAYPPRSQPQSLHHPLMSTAQEQVGQAVSYPAFAYPAIAYYSSQSAIIQQSSQNPQLQQQSGPSSVNGLSRSVYTSAPTHGTPTHGTPTHGTPTHGTPTHGRLPDLLPAPPNGNGRHSFSNAGPMHQPEAVEERPTHVVGSQGRRGILPSTAGRPTAVAGANTSGQKAAPTPPKDAEGKYPCPHCTKTYLHAKHLKRHLLRREYSTHDCL